VNKRFRRQAPRFRFLSLLRTRQESFCVGHCRFPNLLFRLRESFVSTRVSGLIGEGPSPGSRIPTSSLWQIAAETAERTVAEWKTLEQKDLLPKNMGASIEKQILGVAATVTAHAGA
jgi:hypothetical protein